MKKRLAAAFLALCMIVTLLPGTAFAAEGNDPTAIEVNAVKGGSSKYNPKISVEKGTDGNEGKFVVTITAEAAEEAADEEGSVKIEYSTDGKTWKEYDASAVKEEPIAVAAGTTVYARVTGEDSDGGDITSHEVAVFNVGLEGTEGPTATWDKRALTLGWEQDEASAQYRVNVYADEEYVTGETRTLKAVEGEVSVAFSDYVTLKADADTEYVFKVTPLGDGKETGQGGTGVAEGVTYNPQDIIELENPEFDDDEGTVKFSVEADGEDYVAYYEVRIGLPDGNGSATVVKTIEIDGKSGELNFNDPDYAIPVGTYSVQFCAISNDYFIAKDSGWSGWSTKTYTVLPEMHNITLDGEVEGGSVKITATSSDLVLAELTEENGKDIVVNSTVTLTAIPDPGYKVTNLTVTGAMPEGEDDESGEIQKAIDAFKSSGKLNKDGYTMGVTFTMPQFDVEVTAEFEKVDLEIGTGAENEDGEDPGEIALLLTKTATLTYEGDDAPEGKLADGVVLTWKSADTSVATVSDKGVVKAVGVGMTEISLYANVDGDDTGDPLGDPVTVYVYDIKGIYFADEDGNATSKTSKTVTVMIGVEDADVLEANGLDAIYGEESYELKVVFNKLPDYTKTETPAGPGDDDDGETSDPPEEPSEDLESNNNAGGSGAAADAPTMEDYYEGLALLDLTATSSKETAVEVGDPTLSGDTITLTVTPNEDLTAKASVTITVSLAGNKNATLKYEIKEKTANKPTSLVFTSVDGDEIDEDDQSYELFIENVNEPGDPKDVVLTATMTWADEDAAADSVTLKITSSSTAVATVEKANLEDMVEIEEGVATITFKVTPVAPGTTTITVEYGGKTAKLKLTVVANTVTSLTFADGKSTKSDSVDLDVDNVEEDSRFPVQEYELTVNVPLPEEDLDGSLEDAEPVVTYSKTGVATAEAKLEGKTITLTVTPVAAGSTSIKVTFGGKSATLTFKVGAGTVSKVKSMAVYSVAEGDGEAEVLDKAKSSYTHKYDEDEAEFQVITYVIDVTDTEGYGIRSADILETLEVTSSKETVAIIVSGADGDEKMTEGFSELYEDGKITVYVKVLTVGSTSIKVKFGGKTATIALKVRQRLQKDWFALDTTTGVTGDNEQGYTASYTGSAIKPKVVKTAEAPSDVKFSAKYANNKEVGEDDAKATVTLKGSGNYYGDETTKLEFAIEKVDLSETTVTVTGLKDKTYNGKEQLAKITVKVNVNGKAKTLKLGKDYTIEYEYDGGSGGGSGAAGEGDDSVTPKDAGSYTLTITGMGNYENEASGEYTYNIKPAAASKMKVTMKTSVKWADLIEGEETTVEVDALIDALDIEVKGILKETLTPDEDYTVTIKNSSGQVVEGSISAKGKYTVVITPAEEGSNYDSSTSVTKSITIK